MQAASSLLALEERTLNRRDRKLAARFFREICDLYPETMERLAKLYYLRAQRRREPLPAVRGG
jgi:hypothetical protein